MDISKIAERLCESGRNFAANIVDSFDLLVDLADMNLKCFEITVIAMLVKGCSKISVALANRARDIAKCIEEDERSAHDECRR